MEQMTKNEIPLCGAELDTEANQNTRGCTPGKRRDDNTMFMHAAISHNSTFHLGAGPVSVPTSQRRKRSLNLRSSLKARGVWVSNTDLPDSQAFCWEKGAIPTIDHWEWKLKPHCHPTAYQLEWLKLQTQKTLLLVTRWSNWHTFLIKPESSRLWGRARHS